MNNHEIIAIESLENRRLFQFGVDSLRQRSPAYIAWLLGALGLSTLVYLGSYRSPLSSILPSIFVYYLVVVVHVAFRIRSGGRQNALSPDVLFILLYTMFHLGYVTLYGLGLVPYVDDIFFFEDAIPKALFIINLGLIAFLFGYEVTANRTGRCPVPGPVRIPHPSWALFGLACMIIGTAGHLSVIGYLSVGFFQAHGYAAIQDVEKYTGSYSLAFIWRHSLQLMILGLIIYVGSSALRYGKLFQSKLALILTVAFIILITLEGDRGPLVQLGVPILLIRHYLVKRFQVRYLVAMLVAILALFSAVSVVRTIVLDPSKMIQEYRYQRTAGKVRWFSPLVEMGGSFNTVNITAHEVPSVEPYWKGASWRDAAFHIVPFFQGLAGRLGWMTWTPGDWLTITYFGPDAAGRAFSVSAEGFINFGYPGVFLELSLLGAFMKWLTIKFSRNPSMRWALIMFGCIVGSIMLIRNHLGIVSNVFAQIMVLAWILNIWLGDEVGPETIQTG